VNTDGIKGSDTFHWSKQVSGSEIYNGVAATFQQNSYTTLTYTAEQAGGADGTAITDGVKVTFNTGLTAATADAIGAYLVSTSGAYEEVALTDDGDSDDTTWLIDIDEQTLKFNNGDSVTVDLFGVAGYPITTAAQTATVYNIAPAADGTATAVVEPEQPTVDSSGVAEAVVTADLIDKAIEDAQKAKADNPSASVRIEIAVPSAATAPTGVTVSLPTAALGSIATTQDIDSLLVNTEVGEFEIPKAVISTVATQASSAGAATVTLSITKENVSQIPADDQTQMAGAAIFDIVFKAGTTELHDLGADIKINLPYTLKSGETADNVKVYYLPDQGDPQRIDASKYANGKISFPTNHLSLWAVKAMDTTQPSLSSGKVARTSETAAKIGFNTNEAGAAYYTAVQSGAAAPAGDAVVSGGTQLGAVVAGDVADKAVTLTKGAKDIYVVVKDKEGNLSAPLNIAAQTVKVTFDANGGKATTALSAKSWDSVKLPKTTRAHYTFGGWYDGSKNVGKAGAEYEVTADVTLKAKWTIVKHSVKLNANGGTVSKAKVKTLKKNYGSKLGKLTKPTRKGYQFKGWYTKKKSGAKVVTSKKVLKNVTYYAQWERTGKIGNCSIVKVRSKPSAGASVNAVKV
jgi:uncharacterized repeat protein (TIGR02543 family)